MKESLMKVFFQIATLSSVLIISGTALAQQANDGVSFGQGVVAPAAHDGSLLGGVQQQVPGSDRSPNPSQLDDTVQSNLADDEEAGTVRGYGRNDAPGRQ
jgi:hypothetical protein